MDSSVVKYMKLILRDFQNSLDSGGGFDISEEVITEAIYWKQNQLLLLM